MSDFFLAHIGDFFTGECALILAWRGEWGIVALAVSHSGKGGAGQPCGIERGYALSSIWTSESLVKAKFREFTLLLQRHFALPGSSASVLGTLQRSLIIFATH